MKRSLAILVSALSISAMTVPMTLPVWAEAADTKEEASDTQDPVSYTHLTLPTIA